MNAELAAAGEERIVVPTVSRANCLSALKAPSQPGRPEPMIRMLQRALPLPLHPRYPLRKLLVALEHDLLNHDSVEERLRREIVGIGSCRRQRTSDFVFESGGQ